MNRMSHMFTRSTTYIILLFIIAVVSSILAFITGPRIVEINDTLDQRNQTIEFIANSKIAEMTDISIKPQIRYEVRQFDYSVLVNFSERLQAGEAYELSMQIKDVNGDVIDIQHSFSVDELNLYYLKRQQFGDDQIVLTDIEENTNEEVIVELSTILAYSMSKNYLYVLEQTTGKNKLHKIDIDSKKSEFLEVPENITVTSLSSSQYSDTLLLNTATSDYQSVVYTLDETGFSKSKWEDADKTSVAGSRGEILDDRVSYLYFKDYTTLMIATLDEVDEPISLGSVNDFLDSSLDNSTLLLRRNNVMELVSTDGESNPVTDTIPNYVGDIHFYNDINSYMYLDYSAGEHTVMLYSNGTTEKLKKFNSSLWVIRNLNSSPDKIFYGVEVIPRNTPARTDISINNPPDNTVTEIYDHATGELKKRLEGINLVWR